MRSCCLMLAVSAASLLGPLQADGAELLRDPTRPYSVRSFVSAGAATFNVTAIFVSQKRRVAIVNGRRVTEGDQVDGATVVEIRKDGLRLNLDGKALTTRLLPAALRK